MARRLLPVDFPKQELQFTEAGATISVTLNWNGTVGAWFADLAVNENKIVSASRVVIGVDIFDEYFNGVMFARNASNNDIGITYDSLVNGNTRLYWYTADEIANLEPAEVAEVIEPVDPCPPLPFAPVYPEGGTPTQIADYQAALIVYNTALQETATCRVCGDKPITGNLPQYIPEHRVAVRSGGGTNANYRFNTAGLDDQLVAVNFSDFVFGETGNGAGTDTGVLMGNPTGGQFSIVKNHDFEATVENGAAAVDNNFLQPLHVEAAVADGRPWIAMRVGLGSSFKVMSGFVAAPSDLPLYVETGDIASFPVLNGNSAGFGSVAAHVGGVMSINLGSVENAIAALNRGDVFSLFLTNGFPSQLEGIANSLQLTNLGLNYVVDWTDSFVAQPNAPQSNRFETLGGSYPHGFIMDTPATVGNPGIIKILTNANPGAGSNVWQFEPAFFGPELAAYNAALQVFSTCVGCGAAPVDPGPVVSPMGNVVFDPATVGSEPGGSGIITGAGKVFQDTANNGTYINVSVTADGIHTTGKKYFEFQVPSDNSTPWIGFYSRPVHGIPITDPQIYNTAESYVYAPSVGQIRNDNITINTIQTLAITIRAYSRIDYDTGLWEISTDAGATWVTAATLAPTADSYALVASCLNSGDMQIYTAQHEFIGTIPAGYEALAVLSGGTSQAEVDAYNAAFKVWNECLGIDLS